METAVLLLIFNRPETTERVFAAIRSARPERLYVAADGPREGREGEFERAEHARRIATNVDWPCKVETLFRDGNLGCRKAVSSAIDWFFEKEPEGIILEDDCVPLSSFFPYAEALLCRYRSEPRVMMISGLNTIADQYAPASSYFFTAYPEIWGWATWRRAWVHYDVEMRDWPVLRSAGFPGRLPIVHRRFFTRQWIRSFDATHAGRIDTWDYQWAYSIIKNGGLSIAPRMNLVTNIGFGGDATHTTEQAPNHLSRTITRDLTFPLSHPAGPARDTVADRLREHSRYREKLIRKIHKRSGWAHVARGVSAIKGYLRNGNSKTPA